MSASQSSGDISPESPVHVDVRIPPPRYRLSSLALVFAGAVAGTLCRYWLEEVWPHEVHAWPGATFAINLAGAFVLGLLMEFLARGRTDTGRRKSIRLLCGTGFCGAFTTYSTFALESVLLMRENATALALGYLLASMIGGVCCAWAGVFVAARLRLSERDR